MRIPIQCLPPHRASNGSISNPQSPKNDYQLALISQIREFYLFSSLIGITLAKTPTQLLECLKSFRLELKNLARF